MAWSGRAEVEVGQPPLLPTAGVARLPAIFAGVEGDLEQRRRRGERPQLEPGRQNHPGTVAALPVPSATRVGLAPIQAPDVPESLTGAQ